MDIDKLKNEYQVDCNILKQPEFWFDLKTSELAIVLRSPSGVEQVGKVGIALNLYGFAGLGAAQYLSWLTAKGWSWKLTE